MFLFFFVNFTQMLCKHSLPQWFLRSHLALAVVWRVLYLGTWEGEYCQQMETAPNPFSSLLLYQKVINNTTWLPCWDTLSAITLLKGKAFWVFSAAMTLQRSSIPTWGISTLLCLYPWVLWLLAWPCRHSCLFFPHPQVPHESIAPLIGVCKTSHKSQLTALMRSSLMLEVSITLYFFSFYPASSETPHNVSQRWSELLYAGCIRTSDFCCIGCFCLRNLMLLNKVILQFYLPFWQALYILMCICYCFGYDQTGWNVSTEEWLTGWQMDRLKLLSTNFPCPVFTDDEKYSAHLANPK